MGSGGSDSGAAPTPHFFKASAKVVRVGSCLPIGLAVEACCSMKSVARNAGAFPFGCNGNLGSCACDNGWKRLSTDSRTVSVELVTPPCSVCTVWRHSKRHNHRAQNMRALSDGCVARDPFAGRSLYDPRVLVAAQGVSTYSQTQPDRRPRIL